MTQEETSLSSNGIIAGQCNVPNIIDYNREPIRTPQSADPSYNNSNSIYNYEAASLSSINSEDLLLHFVDVDMELLKEVNEYMPRLGVALINNTNSLPTMEEHDQGGLNFELNLPPQKTEGGNNNWCYSPKLNKVFISLKNTFEVKIVHAQCNDPLYLRIMLVFTDECSLPVNRCNNHLCRDPTENKNERDSVIRCLNSDVEYKGSIDGKNINDRLSVYMKLSSAQPDQNNLIEHAIALKFACQNSCIGRRPTVLIFTLETETHTLGKKVMNVKVCSCPKRDKNKDEEKFELKRSAEQAELPSGKRPAKVCKIKQEPGTANSPKSESDDKSIIPPLISGFSMQPTSTGSFLLTMELPNFRSAHKVTQYAFDNLAGELASHPSKSESLKPYLKDLKKNLDNF